MRACDFQSHVETTSQVAYTADRYLSPGSFLLGPPQLQAVVNYLIRTGRYDRLDGHGRLLSAHGERRITVEDSRVVL
ncbi:hypothetical protein ACFV2U_24830 [Streptomyces sp. NPDC059697]|uniref:hypothetical protein n=1 Tax=Streptomyces sp. NPDC059697 TaxID=3346912 RepID=UPI00367C0F13